MGELDPEAEEKTQGNDPETHEENSDERIVVLRPIWKGVIAIILVLVCLLTIYNLIHTIDRIKHPKTHEDKQKNVTAATDLDTHWYQNEKIHLSKIPATSTVRAQNSMTKFNEITAQTNPESVPQAQEEIQKAMSASISSNQIIGELNSHNLQTTAQESSDKVDNLSENTLSILDNKPTFEKRKSPYLLQAGTIIPGVLISGINSDLPGQVIAQVRNPVYDSMSGKYLLIPQGAKLIGHYDAKICFGQKRLFLFWERILFPNGDGIQLGEMPGGDSQGYSGFKDQVDNHYASLFRSALLMSILSAGASVASPTSNGNTAITAGPALGQSVGMHIAETGSQLVSKTMDVQPTLNIRPGYLFNITVTKDVVFDQPY